MAFQYHPSLIYYAVSGFACLFAAWTAWRRSAPGSSMLGWLLLSMALWVAADVMLWIQTSLAAKILWMDVMLIGVVSAPPLFLLFILKFTGTHAQLPTRSLILLLIHPILTLLLQWTNQSHHLVLSSVDVIERNGYVLIELTRGPWYFISSAYLYTLNALGCIILVRSSFRSSPLYGIQSRLILIGGLIPMLFSLYSQLFFESIHRFDLSPVSYGLTSMIFLYATLRTKFMDLIPVARSQLIETMQDGVLVLD